MNVLQSKVRTIAPWILVASMALSISVARADESMPTSGAWTLTHNSDGRVDLELSMHTTNDSWNDGTTESLSEFHNLAVAQLDGAGTNVHFSIVRDPGSFVCDGWVAHGSGGGTFAYAPSTTFAAQLQSRRMGALTPMEQFRMTMSNVTLAYIDELRKDGYRPSASEIISMEDHGVNKRYVEGLLSIGYHPVSIDDLIRLRDHGVSAAYAGALKQEGYAPSIDDLVRLRDHGVTAAFIEHLKKNGYHPSIDDLIRLRDVGI